MKNGILKSDAREQEKALSPGGLRIINQDTRMVERSSRGKRKRLLLANHQQSWLWGRRLVLETLAAGRWPIVELRLADDLSHEELEHSRAAAERLNLRAQVVPRDALRRLCHTSEHQGYLARMGPFPYRRADELLAAAPKRPLYLILDGLQDPYNVGAILRSADAFGVEGVFIGERHQVPVTSMVARSSAGGVNRVPIARVADLPALARTLRERDIQVAGASEKGAVSLTACDFAQGTAVVIGNEGIGISPEILAACDTLVQIPMSGALGSLNASVAAAVLCYEAQRQRRAPATTASAT